MHEFNSVKLLVRLSFVSFKLLWENIATGPLHDSKEKTGVIQLKEFLEQKQPYAILNERIVARIAV